jgi:hypothetical protein
MKVIKGFPRKYSCNKLDNACNYHYNCSSLEKMEKLINDEKNHQKKESMRNESPHEQRIPCENLRFY